MNTSLPGKHKRVDVRYFLAAAQPYIFARRTWFPNKLPIKGSDRHLTDYVVRLRLVATVNDIAFLFVGKHRIGGRGAIPRALQLARIDGDPVKLH